MEKRRGSNFRKRENHPVTFIPYIFKTDLSKSSIVNPSDPFLTDAAGREYCSLLSTNEDKMPNYLKHFKNFTDSVLDFPENTLEDIAKMHIERELAFREEEKKEEELEAKQHEFELKEKTSLDKKVTKMMNIHKFYVKRSCPVKIPFKSTLSHEEHEFYLKAFIKFQSRPPVNTLEEREHAQYMSMQNRVFNEQTCMMNFSYKVAQLLLKEYNVVSSVIENYIKDYVSHRCQRAVNYPGNYKNEIEIPLRPLDIKTTPNHFELNHLGHLLSLGYVPWLKIPNYHVRTDLPKDGSVAEKKRPDCDDLYDSSNFLYKCPVSEDPNAEYLAKAHNASIVMSAGAFKTIVDNQEQPFDKEWNVPVRIKSYTKKDESGREISSRIIFIDKPLAKKTWFPLQKKQTFYKASAKVKLTQYLQQPCFKMRNDTMEDRQYSKPWRRPDFQSSSSDNAFGYDYQPLNRPTNTPQGTKRKFLPKDDVLNDLFLTDEDDDGESGGSSKEQQSPETNSKRPRLQFAPPSVYHPVNKNQNEKPKHVHPKANPYPGPHKPNFHNQSPNQPTPHNPNPHTPSPQKASPNKSNPQNQSLHNPSLQKTESPNLTSKSDDTEKGGFLDDLLSKQSSFLKPKSSVGLSPDRLNPSLTPVLANFDSQKSKNKQQRFPSKPWSKHIGTNWNNCKVKDCPAGGTNVHYQLFSFESTEQSPVKTERAEPIRIIIRHNVHGLSRFKKHPKKSSAYVIFPKLENQVYFGCEVTSLSEIVQQWAALVTRPNIVLLQVRVCVDSGAVVMTEEKTLQTVLKEGKQNHLNFNPQTVFSTLNVLFNILIKMGSGDYLLHHSTKTEAFMKLFKAIKADNQYASYYDMHKFYADGSISSCLYNKNPPWLTIDTHIITPFHMFHKKIPATFPMEHKRKLSKNERKKIRAKATSKMSVDEL